MYKMEKIASDTFEPKRFESDGKITLRGQVTPIGGVKEKILAAKRAGITDLLLCKDHRRDIEEIPAEYLKGVEFHYASEISEVWKIALLDEKVSNAQEIVPIQEPQK